MARPIGNIAPESAEAALQDGTALAHIMFDLQTLLEEAQKQVRHDHNANLVALVLALRSSVEAVKLTTWWRMRWKHGFMTVNPEWRGRRKRAS